MTLFQFKKCARLYALAIALCAAACTTAVGQDTTGGRPSTWGVKMQQIEGVPNFHKITDNLYRSAQPTEAGMAELKKMGIKTVINLRAFHSDKDEIGSTGLLNERLHINTWHIEDEDVVKVMRIVGRKEDGPFLIHCQHGADRTGVMSAMYRILYQGWTKEAAIEEMVQGGYGFHSVWGNIIKYVQFADTEKLRKAIRRT